MGSGIGIRPTPMLNVLIVDDEPLAHTVLLHYCRDHHDIQIVGQCYNAAEALAALSTHRVDLMFLDIRMPRFGGLDLLRGLDRPPLTVVASAHREHAHDGFELDVVDYLLKPVGAARFAAALDKVRRRLTTELSKPETRTEELVLKVDRSLRRFRIDRISYFQAQGNFVKVCSDDGHYLATVTLRKLLETLPDRQFAKVHRSFVVRRDRILEQRRTVVRLSNGAEVPIGRSYRNLKFL
jgi:two-component system, LytTR family, response regulator